MRKKIKGFEDSYEIDEQGNVYSLARQDSQGRHIKPRKLKLMTRNGCKPFYGLSTHIDNKQYVKTKYRHILVADTFNRKHNFKSFKNEVWKTYDKKPKYEISNLGRLRVKGHFYLPDSMEWTEYKLISAEDNGHGYQRINISGKTFYIHRMVAEVFIPNPNDYKEINHKNEVRNDNRASNLEWCTHQYNNSYGNRSRRNGFAKSNVIVGFGKNLSVILPSSASANNFFGKTGASSSIKNNLNGLSKTALKMKWYRVKLPDVNQLAKTKLV